MRLQTVALANVLPQPWKNGGGVTRELLAWPEPAHWRVRLSVAEVTAEGPFSRFEGVQRWFAVLQGDGVRLTVDGAVTEMGGGDAPLGFSGEAATHCALLGGPTRDFNLMLRGATGALKRLNGADEATVFATNLIAVYAASARAEVHFGSETCLLERGCLGWAVADAPTRVALRGPDLLWACVALEDSP